MTYEEILEQLLYRLESLEHELWVTPRERIGAGVAENMVFDKQNEISDMIGDIVDEYATKMSEVE